MLLAAIIASTLVLLAEVPVVSAKAISHMPGALRRRHHHLENFGKSAGRILRREPQSNSLLSVAPPTNTTNQTISAACIDSLSKVTSVDNDAGLAACYNILQFDSQQGAFEADLRLYQMFDPSGDFQGVAVNDIMLSVTYPASTMFQSLTKRKKRDVGERQSTATEVQQYTLFGTFQKNLDISKLNDTQLMSLMLPDVKLNAVNATQAPITANVTAADGAWFVVGQFTGEFKAAQVSPTIATAAIAAAAPFVLPGVTLGIFPTGLIVTCAWTLLFFLAYGFGTLGRIKYRDAYRKRKAAQAGRTGKRI
ncbi:hypothetical protein A1O1_03786 [Capronia coronata CBS 617.96]|uniref:Protein BIG1 n=1 Tax=Capronia coronata CBS 617.96 TaxID=1182541 RepID=W9YCS2_9EURO|nr:uncharacterized protein A1O1_03786 [Capronia coronata CBS 617.96]EXJ90682.1 hypothetical protein A1O1_03786 [Capronia coronata CBS 617.96]